MIPNPSLLLRTICPSTLAAFMLCLAVGSVSGQPAQPSAPGSDAGGPKRALPPEILDVTWEWLGLQTPKAEITVIDPASYTLTFSADGGLALQVNCNRGVSSYTLSQDNRIAIAPIGTTMMLCEGETLDGAFTTNLERVNSFFQLEGDLLLEQPFDSGTMRFRRSPAGTTKTPK